MFFEANIDEEEVQSANGEASRPHLDSLGIFFEGMHAVADVIRGRLFNNAAIVPDTLPSIPEDIRSEEPHAFRFPQ